MPKTLSASSEEVPTQIKNTSLVQERRRQIVEAAITLFIQNGFHKTTTRQIAKAASVSIGSMYEYMNSKEDILYLVCVSIHDYVERGIKNTLSKTASGRSALSEIIREFFMICDRMSDQILLMYQVTQSLPPRWKEKVLENEIRITKLFANALKDISGSGGLPVLTDKLYDLLANNISVLGHKWTFRRWYLNRHYNIEEYIKVQTDFILGFFDQYSD